MNMKDAYNGQTVVSALAPAVQAATIKGGAIDLRGYGSALVIINSGAIAAAGDFGVKLQESDTTTDADFTDVAAADVIGALPASLTASTSFAQSYIGKRRYIRVVATKNGGTSIAAGAVAVLGHRSIAP
jgi:hypothetical protein